MANLQEVCNQCNQSIRQRNQYGVSSVLACLHTTCQGCLAQNLDTSGTLQRVTCQVAGCGQRCLLDQCAVWLPSYGSSLGRLLPCENGKCRFKDADGSPAPATYRCDDCRRGPPGGGRSTGKEAAQAGKKLCAGCYDVHLQVDDYSEHTVEQLPRASGVPSEAFKLARGVCSLRKHGNFNKLTLATRVCNKCAVCGCDACIEQHIKETECGGFAHTITEAMTKSVQTRLAETNTSVDDTQRGLEMESVKDEAAKAPFQEKIQEVDALEKSLITAVKAAANVLRRDINKLMPEGAADHQRRSELQAILKMLSSRISCVSTAEYAGRLRAILPIHVAHYATAALTNIEEIVGKLPQAPPDDAQQKRAMEQVQEMFDNFRSTGDVVFAALERRNSQPAVVPPKVSSIEPEELMNSPSPPNENRVPNGHRDAGMSASASKRPAASTAATHGEPREKRAAGTGVNCVVCNRELNGEANRDYFKCAADAECEAIEEYEKNSHGGSGQNCFCFGCHIPPVNLSPEELKSRQLFCLLCDPSELAWKHMNHSTDSLKVLDFLLRLYIRRGLKHHDRILSAKETEAIRLLDSKWASGDISVQFCKDNTDIFVADTEVF